MRQTLVYSANGIACAFIKPGVLPASNFLVYAENKKPACAGYRLSATKLGLIRRLFFRRTWDALRIVLLSAEIDLTAPRQEPDAECGEDDKGNDNFPHGD